MEDKKNIAVENGHNPLTHTPDAIVAQLEACAVEFYGKKKLARARSYLEQLVLMRPDDAKFWALLGVVCRRQNRRGAALKCLKRAAELDPEDFNILVNLGETLIEVGKVPAGVDLLRAVFDEGYDSSKPPEEQDEFTIRSGATLEFIQKSLREFIDAKKAPADS
jgi:predicted Zn-dependent protease